MVMIPNTAQSVYLFATNYHHIIHANISDNKNN